MKILIGTTNAAKAMYYERLLEDIGIECMTLCDLGIEDEPEEIGQDSIENARIKAAFYGAYWEIVLCNDAGLYFTAMEESDVRQPGLHVRTPYGSDHRLNDEEMISYYTRLVHSLGGETEAYYLTGLALYCKGKIYTKIVKNREVGTFRMYDHVIADCTPGHPLDSISGKREDKKQASVGEKEFLMAILKELKA